MSYKNIATFIFFSGMFVLIFGGLEWFSTTVGAIIVVLSFFILYIDKNGEK